MFRVHEYNNLFYIVEDESEWIADIRETIEQAELSCSYLNGEIKDAPFEYPF